VPDARHWVERCLRFNRGRERVSSTGVPGWELGAEGSHIELGTGLTAPEDRDGEYVNPLPGCINIGSITGNSDGAAKGDKTGQRVLDASWWGVTQMR